MNTVIERFSWARLPGALLQSFGALWLLVEIADYFFPNADWTAWIQSSGWLFFICGLMLGVLRAWPKQSVEARIEGTDVVVEVRIGSIFNREGAIIVGSNTTFDTSLEDGTISSESVQGQFTEQYFTNISELDRKLDAALDTVPSISNRTSPDYA